MSFHRSSSSRDRPLTAVSLAESAASLELHSAVTLLAVFPRDVVAASDGWEAAEGGVRPVVVVRVEPLGKQVEWA
jgi:hypothetical protein